MEVDLESLFEEIFKICQNNDYSSLKSDELYELIRKIEDSVRAVASEALFSNNEELDDISTETLKYLFLDYYYGKCLINIQDMDTRIKNLNSGKVALQHFIDKCKDYNLLHETELTKIDEKKVS
jgi:hypothetical protein